MTGRSQLSSIVLCVFVLTSLAGGCASSNTKATSDPSQNDPYESFNRRMFEFSDRLDRNVMLPVAKGYVKVVPEPARDGVHNILDNLNEPITLANDILQGEPKHAIQSVGRMIVNTSIGLGGLVDVATPMGIPPHEEDFGITLALWGVDEGPYLFLPLFGPSNPRDLGGRLVDIGFDPMTYIGFDGKDYFSGSRQLAAIVDERSRNIDTLDELRKSSVDLYATLRSLYRQHRNSQIRGGKPDLQNLPNI
jgi:phospholipid-binding lipoprotein MlaA